MLKIAANQVLMSYIKIFTNSFINDLIYDKQIFTIIMSISDLQAELIGIISEADHTRREGASIQQLAVENFAQVEQVFPNN
ncbi:MAG: hypothetical protein PG981_000813 [Wolbachia endosymbiont of Ctenocephalides orientis wCori]|nr:MAG: hypothetical protein PG981_000813 [Wolbachia endosymbiont of Ctenocephalides orientis wCori]